MNDEVAKIKESAAREAEEERKQILEGAQREAQRIIEFANREIDSEVRRAHKELRSQVANLAVNQSRKIIEEELNDQDHKRLLENYIEDFDK
jgi:F-type H+-transporting ATPase subunit b